MFDQLKNQYLKEETSYAQEECLSMKMLAIDSDEITKHFKDRSSFQYEIIQPPDNTVENTSSNVKLDKPRTSSFYTRQQQIHSDLLQKIQEIKQSSNKYDEIASKFERKGQLNGIQTKKLSNKRKIKGELEKDQRNKENEIVSNQVIDAYLRGDRIEIEGANHAERFLEEEYKFNFKKNQHFQQRNSINSHCFEVTSSLNNYPTNNENSCYAQQRVNTLASCLPSLPSPVSIRVAESPISQTTNSPCSYDKSRSYFSKFSNHTMHNQLTKSNLPSISSSSSAKPTIPPRCQQQQQQKSNSKQDLPRQRLVFQELLNQVDKLRADSFDRKEDTNNVLDCNINKCIVSQENNEINIISQNLKDESKERLETQQQQQQQHILQIPMSNRLNDQFKGQQRKKIPRSPLFLHIDEGNCNITHRNHNAKKNHVSSISSSKSVFNQNNNNSDNSAAICQGTITDQSSDGQCSPKNNRRSTSLSRYARNLTIGASISQQSSKQSVKNLELQELLLKNQKKQSSREQYNQGGDAQNQQQKQLCSISQQNNPKIIQIPETAKELSLLLLPSQQQQHSASCISKGLRDTTIQHNSRVKSHSFLEGSCQNNVNTDNNDSQSIQNQRQSPQLRGNILISLADSSKNIAGRQRSSTTTSNISKQNKIDLLFSKSVREAAALAERSRQRSNTFQIQKEELMGEDTLIDGKVQNVIRCTRNRQSRILQNYQATRAPLIVKRKIDREFEDILALRVRL